MRPQFELMNKNSLPKFARSVSCLAWAYNERLLIRDYLVRINDLLKDSVADYEIIVIDDASTDGTAEIIRELQKEIPAIVLIQNEKNKNVGYCLRLAIRSAKKEFLFWQTV